MVNVIGTLDDNTFRALQQRALDAGTTLDAEVTRLLTEATKKLPPKGLRYLVVGPAPIDRLEQILGGGSLLHAKDLEAKVGRLAGVSFRHVRLPFTPNQLELLAEKAARQSLTVEQLVERTAPRIYESFFDLMARMA